MFRTLLILFVACIFQVGCTGQSQKENKRKRASPSQAYKIGDTAADFNLKNVDGTMQSLSKIPNAKGYIVIFTGNTCPFAVANEDRMIKLHKKMASKGYPVVAINSSDPSIADGESFEDMKNRSAEKGFPFLYLQDDETHVYAKFGAMKTPHVYLLDKDLKVRYIGAIDDNAKEETEVKVKFVENAIAAIEAGKDPDPAETKAIGCPIKTKSRKQDKGEKGGRPGGPPSPEKLMEMMDTDGDQQISKSEAHGPLARDFDSIDVNEDGKLTEKELENMPKGKRRGPR